MSMDLLYPKNKRLRSKKRLLRTRLSLMDCFKNIKHK